MDKPLATFDLPDLNESPRRPQADPGVSSPSTPYNPQNVSVEGSSVVGSPDSTGRVSMSRGSTGFQDIPLAQKLALITVPLFLGIAIVWLLGRSGLGLMNYHTNNLYNFMLIPIAALKDAEKDFTVLINSAEKLQNANLTNAEREGLIATFETADTEGDNVLETYNSEWVTTVSPEFTATLQIWNQLALQEQEVALLGSINEKHEEAEVAFDTYLETVQNGAPDLTALGTGTSLYNEVLANLGKLIDVNLEFARLSSDDANRGYNRANLVMLLALVSSVLLGILLVAFIARTITRPLQKLAQVSTLVGQGDLSQLSEIQSRDEIGSLASSFDNAIVQLRNANTRQEVEIARGQQLQNNIGDFLNVAMDIAQGDFTRRGQVSEDALGNVVDAINFMTEELGYVLKDVQDATQSVTQGATDMFDTSDEIARSAQQQATEAQKARAEVQVVTSSIRQMATTAGSSAQAAQRTLVASQEGREAVTATLAEMQNIRREVQGVAKRVRGLSERSLEISEIVETISKIAKQTNLLALNAALEASSAGDAGARFATVAGEVRALAENTTASVQRVASLIKNVQDEVQEVLTGVETGNRQVEGGYRVAQQAGERLEEIATIAQQTAQFAQEISSVTLEQVNRVEGVGHAVEQMADISQASQETVTQGREAAERLQTLASQLSSSIARFRIA